MLNSSRNSKEGCSNSASVSVSTTLKNDSTEEPSCRVAELIHFSVHPALWCSNRSMTPSARQARNPLFPLSVVPLQIYSGCRSRVVSSIPSYTRGRSEHRKRMVPSAARRHGVYTIGGGVLWVTGPELITQSELYRSIAVLIPVAVLFGVMELYLRYQE